MKYNEYNAEHDYFFGNQKSLDQAVARHALWNMLENGEITDDQRESAFKSIDKGENPAVMSSKTNDYGDVINSLFHW